MEDLSAKVITSERCLVMFLANGANGLIGLNVAQKEPWKEPELNYNLKEIEVKTVRDLPNRQKSVVLTVNMGNGDNGLIAQNQGPRNRYYVAKEKKQENVT